MLSRLNSLRLSLLSVIPGLARQANYIPVNRPMSSSGMCSYSLLWAAAQELIMSCCSTAPKDLATFASGCFWGTEHIFLKKFPPAESKGILSTRVGYTGGNDDATDPSYREVCSGATGHAEAVQIEYDPSKLKYEDLVGELVSCKPEMQRVSIPTSEYFYRTHDPTTVNKQGPDTGTRTYSSHISSRSTRIKRVSFVEYRSAIFYHTPEQKSIAEQVTAEIQQKYFDPKGQKIVTSIEPAGRWYDAEDYHQEYLFKNPYGYQCPTHREHW